MSRRARALSPADRRAAVAEVDQFIADQHRTLASAARSRRDLVHVPAPRRGETLAHYQRRLDAWERHSHRVGEARNLLPYAERCRAALLAGQAPAVRDLVAGIARGCPTLGRCLFPMAVAAARPRLSGTAGPEVEVLA